MTKTQSNLIVALLGAILLMLGLVAYWPEALASEARAGTDRPSADADPREAVVLNPEQHQFALRQMRELLVTIRNLDEARIADDRSAMARLAREQGPGANRDHPQGFHEALPDGFRAMSKQMRQSFAGMAADLEAGNVAGYDAKRLQALDTCIGCHESYRFSEN